jgi:hypothetical protein
MFVPHRNHICGPVKGTVLPFFYVDDARTSQEAHLWASTACYGDSSTLLYVDDVCTSQESHLWVSMAC